MERLTLTLFFYLIFYTLANIINILIKGLQMASV